MARKKEKDHSFDDGSYVVKKSRKFDIFAFIVCLLVAFIIWFFANGRVQEMPTDPSVETEQTSDAVTSEQIPDGNE